MIPKALRDVAGLRSGDVEVTLDGSGIRVEALAGDAIEEHRGRLRIPPSGDAISAEDVRALRDADQR